MKFSSNNFDKRFYVRHNCGVDDICLGLTRRPIVALAKDSAINGCSTGCRSTEEVEFILCDSGDSENSGIGFVSIANFLKIVLLSAGLKRSALLTCISQTPERPWQWNTSIPCMMLFLNCCWRHIHKIAQTQYCIECVGYWR